MLLLPKLFSYVLSVPFICATAETVNVKVLLVVVCREYGNVF